MTCIHRLYLGHCTRCQVRANLRRHVPPPVSEQERVARKLLAEQAAMLRLLDDEGEGYEPPVVDAVCAGPAPPQTAHRVADGYCPECVPELDYPRGDA